MPRVVRRMVVGLATVIAMTGAISANAQAASYKVSGYTTDNNLGLNAAAVGNMTVLIEDVTNTSASPVIATVSGNSWYGYVPSASDQYDAVIYNGYYDEPATSARFYAPEYDVPTNLTPLNETIKGTVTDTAASEPINAAEVDITGASTANDNLSKPTDTSGNYSGQLPDDQTYKVSIPATNQWGAFQSSVVSNGGGQTFTVNAGLTLTDSEITGTVTDVNDAPVKGAEVFATGDAGSSYAITDATGHYAIDLPGAGAYTIHFVPEQPSNTLSQYYNGTATGTTDPASATTVSVGSDAATTGVDATLATGGTVSGTVTNADGTVNLSGIAVQVDYLDGDEVDSADTTTQSDGSWSIAGVPAGTYTVSAGGNGSGYAIEYYGNVPDPGSATTLSVTDDQITDQINLALPRAGSLTGTVTAAQGGGGIGQVTVSAYPAGQVGDSPSFDASTASDGTYTIPDIPPGQYVVDFDPGNRPYAEQWNGGASSRGAATPITITAAQPSEADAALAPAGYIEGTLTDGSNGGNAGDVNVIAFGADGAEVANTSSDDNGLYRLGGLPAGSYTLEFQPLGGRLAFQFYTGQPSPVGATKVAVTAPGTTPGINATLEPGGSISGHVTDAASGAPVGGADVQLLDAQGDILTDVDSATDGSYTIQGIPAGSYYVLAAPGKSLEIGATLGTYDRDYYGGTDSMTGATAVTVATLTTTSGIDMKLSTGPGQTSTGTNTNTNTTTTSTQTTTTGTSTTATTKQTTTPPKPPVISGGTLTGLAKRKASLGFTVTAGAGAPALHSISVKLPTGVSFTKKAAKAVSVTGAKFTAAVKSGVLIITLPTAVRTAKVRVTHTGLSVTKAEAKAAKRHKLASATVAVAVTDAGDSSTLLTYTVKKPR